MDPGALAAIHSANAQLAKNRDANTWLVLGQTYFAHNLFPEAATCFSYALEIEPGNTRAAYMRAICHDELGEHSQRDAMIAHLIETDQSNPTPRWRAANWALGEGRAEEAAALAESALAIDENNGSARKVLAKSRLALGDPVGAITTLAPLVQGREADPYARYLLGRAFQATGDQAKALRQLTLAGNAQERLEDPWLAETNARRADLAVHLTRLDQSLGEMKLEDAASLLDQLTSRHGAIRELQLRRAELLSRNGQIAEALVANQELLQDHPGWGPALTHRANLAMRFFTKDPANRGESLSAALQAAQEATQRTPGSLDAWKALAQASAASRNNPATLEAFTRCVELAPNVPRYRAAQAEYMIAVGAPQDAETAVREMELLFGKTIESELVRIRLLLMQDRRDEAMIILSRCRQMAPNHPGVRQASSQLMGSP